MISRHASRVKKYRGQGAAMKKHIIFDMDGVIFDTEAVSQRRWFEYGDSFGFYNIKEVYPKIIGTNSADTRRIMINEYKDAEKIAEFKNPRIAKIAAENRKSFGAFWVRPCARWNGFAIYFAIRKSENAENSFSKENGALRKCAPEFTEIWKRKMVQINSAPLNYSS